MEYRRLGDSGLQVSAIGLGCNNFGGRIDQAAADAVVNHAIEAGVTLFDTADVYGGQQSEIQLGKALGARRQQVVIATKFALPMGDGPYAKGGSRRYVFAAVEASLRRLGTDYIDLYQMHRPDPETPIEETLRALDDLVTQGKVRYIGSSNFSGWQIADADWTARQRGGARFVAAQNHYNLLERDLEREVAPACNRFHVGVLPFFPLASGLLSGKYRRSAPPPPDTRLAGMGERGAAMLSPANFDRIEKLSAFASERGHTLLELAFAWLLSHSAVASVIAGATKPEQVRENVAAGAWKLSAAEAGEAGALAR